MTDLTAEAPLAPLVRSFREGDDRVGDARTGDVRIETHYADLRERFAAVEPTIRAFVGERPGEDEPGDHDDAAGHDDAAPDRGNGCRGRNGGRFERIEQELADCRETARNAPVVPPLYGIPVGVKDVIHVDGLPTRAGSAVLPAALSGPQGSVLEALREAGAVVLGKTVTAEFAHFAPGPTRNPHDPDHTPGGSSSGSAAAVAAGLCPLALGTQTIGSVNRPASFCGIVGVTPSAGRVPTDGIVSAAPSVDVVGYFTQDVAGARIAAGVVYPDWRAESSPPPLERIGVMDGPYLDRAGEVARRHLRTHVDRLEAAGYEVVRLPVVADTEPEAASVIERHETLVAAEFALSHAELFPEYGDRYAPATAELIREGRSVSAGALADARAGRAALRDRVHAAMDAHDLDVVVSPSARGPAPEGIDSTGDPVLNLPWTHAGLPTVTVPATETTAGLPVGIQCTARHGADERLLAWCSAIETAVANGVNNEA
ncbi:amidase [Halopenitus persicus]|uniref:Asp-tRNAAsn/Glu-tRNAGln amidotransferase A subunit n=1 Tax=Halopenitus persicus TaxID=1048396 RepID=A0A1H3DSL5_9EURY|nr:amidase [Halopenitus persicus]SDX69522.1 Asp-tRNAAsn/Glu-tRNAGln amidotransferase A subunit [Halopenitus persicus]